MRWRDHESRRTEQSRERHGGARQGHSGRRRNPPARSRSASTPSAWKSPKTIAATIARCCSAPPTRMKNHISGVILYDETIRQKAKDGTPLVKLIEEAGAVPGIKVDAGAKPLPACPGEVITEGLDGLRERLAEISQAGRALRQMARGDRHRRRHPELQLHQRQCACAGALCRACQEAQHRADRRAGSADGRRPRHRPLLRGHRAGAEDRVPGACSTRMSCSKAWC